MVSVFVSAVNHYQTNQTIISMEYGGLFSYCMKQSDHDDGREGQLLGFGTTDIFKEIYVLLSHKIFARRSHLVVLGKYAFSFNSKGFPEAVHFCKKNSQGSTVTQK